MEKRGDGFFFTTNTRTTRRRLCQKRRRPRFGAPNFEEGDLTKTSRRASRKATRGEIFVASVFAPATVSTFFVEIVAARATSRPVRFTGGTTTVAVLLRYHYGTTTRYCYYAVLLRYYYGTTTTRYYYGTTTTQYYAVLRGTTTTRYYYGTTVLRAFKNRTNHDFVGSVNTFKKQKTAIAKTNPNARSSQLFCFLLSFRLAQLVAIPRIPTYLYFLLFPTHTARPRSSTRKVSSKSNPFGMILCL